MRQINKILLIGFLAATVMAGKAHAQELAFRDYDEPDNGKWDRETENLINPSAYSFPSVEPVDPDSAATKDSLLLKAERIAPTHTRLKNEQSPAQQSKPAQGAHEDDSILSFNFLYYIIQKYKLQDIVD